MKTIKYKGFSYSVIIKAWKKGNAKYEVIKREIGFRANWIRVSIDEYFRIKKLINNE
jgi:hypothetical protein